MEETKEKKAPAKAEAKKNTWEYKDRNYYLIGSKDSFNIYNTCLEHSARYPCVWFDPDLGYERELKICY